MMTIAPMLRDRAIAFCRDTSGIILPYVTLLLTVLVGTRCSRSTAPAT